MYLYSVAAMSFKSSTMKPMEVDLSTWTQGCQWTSQGARLPEGSDPKKPRLDHLGTDPIPWKSIPDHLITPYVYSIIFSLKYIH